MSQTQKKLIGPFTQVLTMQNLPVKGPVYDGQLDIIENGGILVDGDTILSIGHFPSMEKEAEVEQWDCEVFDDSIVCVPGFIDAHTHLCWAGARERDYALRVAGKSYRDIAAEGGGIIDTVNKTRAADFNALKESLIERCERHRTEGVTTCEVKSGYGLNVEHELRILKVIDSVNNESDFDLVPTCLAAHTLPRDFKGSSREYLDYLSRELLPRVKKHHLCERVDIFIEEGAFGVAEAREYMNQARSQGFACVMHVDQFTAGGSMLACELGAISADHLEASTSIEIEALGESGVVCVALPGSSMGLGIPFAPARKLLDAGACVAIATDWNPGSAPMGDLLVQAAVLGTFEKLTLAETFAGITFRAARALGLHDRGILAPGTRADFIGFVCDNYQEIFYKQGTLKPAYVWKNGVRC